MFNLSSNFLLGCIYIPPEYSKYSSLEAFDIIESEMVSTSDDCDYFSLIGDFNSKTADLPDFVKKR